MRFPKWPPPPVRQLSTDMGVSRVGSRGIIVIPLYNGRYCNNQWMSALNTWPMGWPLCSGADLSVSSSLLTNKSKVGQHWQIWNSVQRNLRSWDFVQYSLVTQLRAIHRHSFILTVGTDKVNALESKSTPSQVIRVEGLDPCTPSDAKGHCHVKIKCAVQHNA